MVTSRLSLVKVVDEGAFGSHSICLIYLERTLNQVSVFIQVEILQDS